MKTGTRRIIDVVLVGLLAACAPAAPDTLGTTDQMQAPSFDVDPFWPRPLPNGWLLGSAVGVAVDERDHVWVVHRGSSIADAERGDCCASAPPVLEFDPDGALVGAWGGPGDGYDWPEAMHGIAVDGQGRVWLGGSGDADSHVLIFSRSGQFLQQFGRPGARRDPSTPAGAPAWVEGNDDREHFGRVAKIVVASGTNEAFLADGYLNRRVAVVDADSGRVTRHWGAYGGEAAPRAGGPARFDNVHCLGLSRDGLLYVCDRFNSRIQVFRPDGTFVAERRVADPGAQTGAAWDIAFSTDPDQAYLYLADGRSMKVRILRRDTLDEVTAFGAGGRQPGQFFGVHSIATDSAGNIYTTEAFEGKRVQKFVYRGLRAVTTADQGTVWPR